MAVKSETNVNLTYNSNELDAYLNTTAMNAVVGTLDTTHFNSTGKEYVNDTPEWAIEIGGHWDSVLDGYLAPDIGGTTLRTVVIGFTDDGSTEVTFTWTASGTVGGIISDYSISASTGGFIEWSGTLRLSGAPIRA